MTRHAPKIAAFALASVALGSLLALTIPTDLRPAPNSKLEQLSAPQIVDYPGSRQALTGQDSYPVIYSPQYLAALDPAERARLQTLQQPAAQDFGYDQPEAARDMALKAQDPGEVTVRRGSADSAAVAPGDDPAELAEADQTED